MTCAVVTVCTICQRYSRTSSHHQPLNYQVAMEMDDATLVSPDNGSEPQPDEDSTWEAI